MMRMPMLVGLGLFSLSVALADDRAEADGLLNRAIKAHGGEALLKQFRAETTRVKGTLFPGGGVPVTQEVSFQMPDQLKEAAVLSFGQQELSVTFVLAGDKGWLKTGDETKDLDDKQLAEMKEAAHVARLTRLCPLRDKAVTLAPVKDVDVDGRPALGLKISAPNHRDVRFYFDKETAFLVRIDRTVFDFNAKKEVEEQKFLSDYADVGGLKLPRKVTILRDGQKHFTGEIIETRPLEKLDPAVFEKP
jgi:hypothetical protein